MSLLELSASPPDELPLDVDVELAADAQNHRMTSLVMAAEITRAPERFSLEYYKRLCVSTARMTPKAEGDFARLSPESLFMRYGTLALPRIFPGIRRHHIEVTSGRWDWIGNGPRNELPTQLHGVDLEFVIGSIIDGIPVVDETSETLDRIKNARGECTNTVNVGIGALLRRIPALDEHVHPKHVEGAGRMTVRGEEEHPKWKTIGPGHTIATVAYEHRNTPMLLLVDPTIAQADHTQAYDVEVAAVPTDDVPDYMRLRYSAHPKSPVYNTCKPLPR